MELIAALTIVFQKWTRQKDMVIGTVVAARKYAGLEGTKLLMVQPLDHTQKPVGEPQVAVDTVRAGPHDLVYLVGSREAALACDCASGSPSSSATGAVCSRSWNCSRQRCSVVSDRHQTSSVPTSVRRATTCTRSRSSCAPDC